MVEENPLIPFQQELEAIKATIDERRKKCEEFDERKQMLDTQKKIVIAAIEDMRTLISQLLFKKDQPAGILTATLAKYCQYLEVNWDGLDELIGADKGHWTSSLTRAE